MLEDEKIQIFLADKCCKDEYSDMFSYEELSTYRRECAEIDYYDANGNRLDLLILGVLRAITKNKDTVNHARSMQ